MTYGHSKDNHPELKQVMTGMLADEYGIPIYEQTLEGKLFVQFVALIYLSYIKKQMHVKGFLKEYTLPGLLDKLDVIECFEQPGKPLRVGEMLEKQNSCTMIGGRTRLPRYE